MKLNIKSILILIIITILNIDYVKAQEIIVHKEDTLVTITPNKVRLINCIIADLELTKEQYKLQSNIIKNDSLIINNKDSIIINQESIIKRKDYLYMNTINDLEKSLKSEEKKKYIYSGVASSLAIILGIFLIIK